MSTIYEKLVLVNSKKKKETYPNFSYLNFSIYLSRDDREFDINNYLLLKKLTHPNKRKFNISKNQKNIKGFYKYLISFKEYKYLPRIKIIFVFILDFLKYIKQILDIFGITIIVLIMGIFITILTIPVSLVVRSKPEDMGLLPDGVDVSEVGMEAYPDFKK